MSAPGLRLIPVYLSLLLACPFAAVGQDWPSFRGRYARGVAEGRATPLTWDLQKASNIKWSVAVPGLGHSSPVIWGDKLFITTAVAKDAAGADTSDYVMGDMTSSRDGGPHVWFVYCFDKRSGRLLWRRKAHEGTPSSKRHPMNSFATPTPAVDGRHLIVFFGQEGLYCYDLEGKLLWKQDVGKLDTGYHADPQYLWGVGSSPIIYKNLVILQGDVYHNPFVAAYDIESGRRVWATKRDDNPSWSTPTIYEDGTRAELITCAPHYVRGYDPRTGEELWRLKWGMDIHTAAPITGKGLIYVSSGKHPSHPSHPLYAIRPGSRGDISLLDGQTSNSHIAWNRSKAGTITTTPLLYGDYLYTLTDAGVLRCFDAVSGEIQYEQRLAATTFFASPVAADGKLYFTSLDGDMYVVKAGPEYELMATNMIGEMCFSTPAISDGMLFVRTRNHLLCVKESGPGPKRDASGRHRQRAAARRR